MDESMGNHALNQTYTMTIELNVLEVIDLRVALQMRIINLKEHLERTKDAFLKECFIKDIEKLNNLLEKI